jgi:hypothetical protein
MAGKQNAITIYPVANYNFGSKAAKKEKDTNVQARLSRWEEK